MWRRYLSDGHGAEDVEEDKGAVGVILAQQVAMWKTLDVGQRHERQFGHNSSIEAENNKQKKKRWIWELVGTIVIFYLRRFFYIKRGRSRINPMSLRVTYMELNMPIKAVKQKPMANMDFMRTYKKNTQD